jgi:uncharacterized membrane protein
MAAAALTNWLGPLIEHDLKEAIEWKEGVMLYSLLGLIPTANSTTVRGFTSKDFSNLFNDDGSSLSIRCRADARQPRIAQIVEVRARPDIQQRPSFAHPLQISQNLKCRLSDGYTIVKGRLLPDARKALQEDGKDTSQLARGMLLSIPEFSIRVTTLGKMDERVQLHLSRVQLYDPKQHPMLGKLNDVSDLTSIKSLMEKLQAISKEPVGERSATASGINASTQSSLRNATQGSRYDDHSQTFATQAVTHGRRHQHAPGAVNLAAPVILNRTGSGLGSQPAIGQNGFKNPDPLGLLMELHPMLGPLRPVPNAASHGLGRRDQVPSLHQAGAESNTRQLLGTSPILTRTEQAVRHVSHVDLVEDDNIAEPVEGDKLAAESPPAVFEEQEEPVPLADPAEHLETGDREILVTHVANYQPEDGATLQGVPDLEADRPADAPRSSSPVVKFEPDSPVHTSNPRAMSHLSTETMPKSSRNATAVRWHGISQLRRSQCLVPQDQQRLLSSKQSWNPPEPGTQYPTPNIPVAYLQQIEQSNLKNNEGCRELAHTASTVPSDAASSPKSASSPSPSPTPEEQVFDWDPSSPVPGYDNTLPPDSSDPDAAHHSQTKPPLQPGNVAQEVVMRSVEQPSPGQGSSRPTSRHSAMHEIQPTSDTWSSAIAAKQLKSRREDLQMLLQPSTLSQSEFCSPLKGPHSIPAAPASHHKTNVVKQNENVQSTYTPAFQSTQGMRKPISFDGTRSSPPPLRITTSDADKMAEAQLQEEFRVSAEKKQKTQLSAAEMASPSSPLDRSRAQFSDEEMAVDFASPPQILGKRLPASPAAERRPRKSRFGFSQEDPISQNPARAVEVERKRFMDERKHSHRQQREQVNARQAHQGHATESAPTVSPDSSMRLATDTMISSPPPSENGVTAITSTQQAAQNDELKANGPSSPQYEHHLVEETSTRHDGSRHLTQQRQAERILTYESLHHAFCAAYNDYKGNLRHFTNLVNDIERHRNAPHPFLWDDFVIRNKTDYLPYSVECLESGERPLPYDTFYEKNIARPQYTQGILNPETFKQLFSMHRAR